MFLSSDFVICLCVFNFYLLVLSFFLFSGVLRVFVAFFSVFVFDYFASFLQLKQNPPLHTCSRWWFSSFTRLAANSTSAMKGETTTPTKTSPIGSNWPSLPIPGDTTETEVSQDIPIQPAQKKPRSLERPAERTGRIRERPGGQICQILQRQ